ncbi:kinase suppressor of Ras 2-like isoform X2 [Gigantopelta aegis]|uniref:kinase suppressor of Ras 2-like isoform X2 n=1 Tax=Gigantopelta aegis TaxID=1735272 RepID=UPI001B8897CF|nr:kinase suppressor of Ras 2-like isoform X2 [Gigantopelta aegis]
MSSDVVNTDPVQQAIDACKMVQFMIEFTSNQLEDLRSDCDITEEITQKEIRDTESKLVKLFSDQLVAKARLATDEVPEQLSEFPKTGVWLLVAGVSKDAMAGIIEREITLDSLLELSEEEVKTLMQRYGARSEEIRTLNAALRNLKLCTERQLQGEDPNQDWHFTELSGVTSSKSVSNSPCGSSPKYHQRPSTSSLPNETLASSPQPPEIPTPPQSVPSSPLPTTHTQIHRYTPPPTPPPPRPRCIGNAKYPITPPPKKKMQLLPDSVTITKSKSHESQLANRVVDIDPVKPSRKKPQNILLGGSHEALFRRRLSTDGSDTGAGSRAQSGHNSPVISSPIRSPPYKHDMISADEYIKYSNTLTVPKSPKTPLNIGPKMLHQISHRFTNTFKITTCDVCHKQMFLGYKCKDCKKKFHRDCAARAPPTCGLSDDYVDAVLNWSESPLPDRRAMNRDDSGLKPVVSMPVFPGGHIHDSSSTSSCNSSTPSSPALHISSGTLTSPSPAPSHLNQFQFPPGPHSDVPADKNVSTLPDDFVLKERHNNHDIDVVNTNTSNDSDKTLIDSNTSDKILLDRVDSVDSQDDPLGSSWNRQNSLSVTMKEWDIPYEDLQIGDAIGKGRSGVVYKGHWHGHVAIKVLDMDNLSDSENQDQLTAFKLEIALLRKTRHENLVLFMGACMKIPRLAIVTSFCKGETLYSIIHEKREQFKLNRAMIVASQIAQGMGYLHAKGIVHKDLRTKNIFLDSGKVVITDFGLFTITKICRGNKKDDWLRVPPGWLCYLSPEIIRVLHARQHENKNLHFKSKSDIYAFGTVWYELLCGDWPFRNQPSETIIWQVGRGMKQSLSTVGAPREVKDILMSCWVFKPDDRPDFSQVAKALDRIPKNRLIRSPSHPIQLSRSTEGIFNA